MEFKDYLKSLYADKSTMTLEELTAAAESNKDSKFVDLKDGRYVDVEKYNGLQGQLNTANTTLKNLQDTVKKFDGVDLDKLQNDVKTWETKYNTDIANLKRESALDIALAGKKAKNPKAVKALLNMDDIKFDGDTLTGLDSQLESLLKSDGYLFDPEDASKGSGTFTGSSGHQNHSGDDMAAVRAIMGLPTKT